MNDKTSETVTVIRFLQTSKRLFDCSVLFLLLFHHFLLGTLGSLLLLLILLQFLILLINPMSAAIAAIQADQLNMALLIELLPLLAQEEEQRLGAKHQGHADCHG